LALLLALRISVAPISLLSFVAAIVSVLLACVAGLFLFWSFGLWTLSYRLDRNRLAIFWLGSRYDIPLGRIERLMTGPAGVKRLSVLGASWFGCQVGRLEHPELGSVLCFAGARSPAELIYVVTAGPTYAISVPNSERFLQEVQRRQTMGPTHEVFPGVRPSPIMTWALWSDRNLWLLVTVCLILNVTLFAFLFARYASLPHFVSLHFTFAGQPAQMRVKDAVFVLPWVALAALFANGILAGIIHNRERAAAYLSLIAAAFLQILFWAAALRVVA
jgi:hypothetical protein